MKKGCLPVVIASILFCSYTAYAMTYTGIVYWGYDNVLRSKQWVSPDGRLSLQSQLDNMSTAWDCWPSVGIRPIQHSICELTLNRYQWDNPRLERISLSAMADQTEGEGAYRISIEKGGQGIHRPLIVCFDNAIPGGVAICPLRITPEGVYVWSDGVYKKL